MVAPVVADPFYTHCDRIVAVFGCDSGEFFGHHFTRADLEEIVKLYGLDKSVKPASGMDLYQRLAGEAEARAVQARMNMTPEQRRATFPLDSYDVDIANLIYRL